MQLSYHINFKADPNTFSHCRKLIANAVHTIRHIPLARIEITKDNNYIENYKVVVFLLEAKCISSLKGEGTSLRKAVAELVKNINTRNKNESLVRAYLSRIEAA